MTIDSLNDYAENCISWCQYIHPFPNRSVYSIKVTGAEESIQ